MSQHADITKEILAKAVKLDLSHKDTADLLTSVLYAAGYEDDMADAFEHEMGNLVYSYLRNQKDGLYGVSHQEIENWINKK